MPHDRLPTSSATSTTVIDPRLSRSSYYDGRLLRAEDLTRDQQYLDQRLREIGRARGEGVITGLHVSLSGHALRIEPGVGITPGGEFLNWILLKR